MESNPSNVSLHPVDLLATPAAHQELRAYASFIVQKDKEVYEELQELNLPFTEFSKSKWEYEPAVWMFVGRNPPNSPALTGRPEHTDSVQHDGTWHYQLAGRKTWFIRPTVELCAQFKQHGLTIPQTAWKVPCTQGDVLVINTRLWFHRTEIPAQQGPSVSYARDFYCERRDDKSNGKPVVMTNVDGVYATDGIPEGAIIFTALDAPGAELHRSDEANCKVCELRDGTDAVVSIRPIQSGEFLCIPPTDDEASVESESSSESKESQRKSKKLLGHNQNLISFVLLLFAATCRPTTNKKGPWKYFRTAS